jgi:hypothetical protein
VDESPGMVEKSGVPSPASTTVLESFSALLSVLSRNIRQIMTLTASGVNSHFVTYSDKTVPTIKYRV